MSAFPSRHAGTRRTRAALLRASALCIALAMPCAYAQPAATPPVSSDSVPTWAYPLSPPPPPPPRSAASGPQPEFGLPDTPVRYTRAQLHDLFDAPDWRPADHPPMPAVVARGRKPGVMACAYCHQPNGVGRPENANLTGLTAAYLQRQLLDFRGGARRSSAPAMLPQTLMVKLASQLTDADIEAAVAYFAALPVASTVRVVEADTVPQSEARGWALAPVAQRGHEPLGQRIIELPTDPSRADLRDPLTRYVAYVPRGSIARGRTLATRDGSTPACAICHGPQLQGLGDVPPLAGRSPSYLVRQLMDFRNGHRQGPTSEPMRTTAARLSDGDIIDAAAYAASLQP